MGKLFKLIGNLLKLTGNLWKLIKLIGNLLKIIVNLLKTYWNLNTEFTNVLYFAYLSLKSFIFKFKNKNKKYDEEGKIGQKIVKVFCNIDRKIGIWEKVYKILSTTFFLVVRTKVLIAKH